MTAARNTKWYLRRRTVLAAAMATLGLARANSALADPDPVGLSIVNRDTGQPLRIWRHHGRLFVAGEPGARYGLRVTNHSDGRVLVVMSVDGVNVLTGETAGYNQRGYVFDPYESYDVTGWRKSDSEVAAFTFAPLPQSYAARTGRPVDVGVIGIAVFREKVAFQTPAIVTPTPAPEPDQATETRGYTLFSGAAAARRAAPPPPASLAAPSPSAAVVGGAPWKPRDDKLGTAHGAREWSVVTTVAFERATPYPRSTRQIEYDTYSHLVAQGVIPPARYGERHPRPFPSDPDEAGYVPDPPGGS